MNLAYNNCYHCVWLMLFSISIIFSAFVYLNSTVELRSSFYTIYVLSCLFTSLWIH